jgi:2-polyprenyl-3-methyl-5-hydroxy-6-metoxy-1,4-benzoquinol methylase
MSYTAEYFQDRAEPAQKDYIMCVQFLQHTMAESVFDMGCGAGKYLKILENMKVPAEGYDPNVKEYSKMSEGTYDLVLCLDVLEHVPEAELDNILKAIESRTKKYAIFSICDASLWGKYVDKTHVTCHSKMWWREKLSKYFKMADTPENWIFKDQIYVGKKRVNNVAQV